MPAQDRVRRHQGRDLANSRRPSRCPTSQAASLALVETQLLPGEEAFQKAILVAQTRDDVGLVTLEPASRCRNQRLRRLPADVAVVFIISVETCPTCAWMTQSGRPSSASVVMAVSRPSWKGTSA